MTGFLWVMAGIGALILVLACIPLLRGREWLPGLVIVLAGVGLGVGVYKQTSNFDPEKPSRMQTVAEQVAGLRDRALARPEDVSAWQRLGNALMQLGDYAAAAEAFEKAYAVSDKTDANLLLDYAEALAQVDPNSIVGQAGHLIDNALSLAPNNMRALWYGGSVAASRGDRELAATRFEKMLRPDTPQNVREVLESNIRALRGEGTPAPASEPASDGKRIVVDVAVADTVGPLPDGATVFVIATTPAGGPPLGVVRLPVTAIPGQVEIGDTNAMIAGRNISSVENVRLVARVSRSGRPQAQAGDIYGEVDVPVATTDAVAITIDQTVK